MITDQREIGKGWNLVGELPDWVREPRKYDFQLEADVQLQLMRIRHLELFQYPEVLGRQYATVTGSKVEPLEGKPCEVLIRGRSKVEYVAESEKNSKRIKMATLQGQTILHIANVRVDGRRSAQLSFERGLDGVVCPKLHFYPPTW